MDPATTLQRRGRLGLALVAIALPFTAANAFSAIVFQPFVTYHAGQNSSAVRFHDLNNDGFPDILTANRESNDVTILLNDGAGGFEDAVAFAVGMVPRSIDIGDLNGDGLDDIVTANWDSGDLSVLFGDGAGSILNTINIPIGNRPVFATIAKIDGDDFPDLVVADSSTHLIHILTNDGLGVFALHTTVTAQAEPRWVEVFDVDGDGDLDCVVANRVADSLTVHLNNGIGAFSSGQVIDDVGARPRSIDAADMDGDGDLDIGVALFGDDGVVVYENAAGLFVERFRAFSGDAPHEIRILDLDKDNVLDLAMAHVSFARVRVFAGTGAFTFAPPALLNTLLNPASLDFADIDLDGDFDVVTGHSAGTITFAKNISQPGAALGDFNMNGVVDGADLATMLSQWGSTNSIADLTQDGIVNGADLATLLANWSGAQ